MKTKEELRVLKIFNPHGLARLGNSRMFITYTPGEEGRMAHYPYWSVVGIGFKVCPDAPWYDNGHKTFHVTHRGNKIIQLNAAIEWCYKNFDIPKEGWEKAPFDSWQLKGTLKRAISKAKLDMDKE